MTREHYDALLRDLDSAVLELGDLVAATIRRCVEALERRDVVEAKRVVEADNEIDARRYGIERQVVLLIATQQPMAVDLRTITAILTIATELERIGDYCEGIAKLTLRMAVEPDLGALGDIDAMAGITQRLLREVLRAFQQRNLEAAGAVWLQDETIDDLYERVFRTLLAEMAEDPSTIRRGTYLLWIAHNLERIADRVTNIAERVAYVVTGDIEAFRHGLEARTVPT